MNLEKVETNRKNVETSRKCDLENISWNAPKIWIWKRTENMWENMKFYRILLFDI